jgi:hypothetical protein
VHESRVSPSLSLLGLCGGGSLRGADGATVNRRCTSNFESDALSHPVTKHPAVHRGSHPPMSLAS